MNQKQNLRLIEIAILLVVMSCGVIGLCALILSPSFNQPVEMLVLGLLFSYFFFAAAWMLLKFS